MKKLYSMAVALMCISTLTTAQSFNNSTSLLPQDHNSGGCVGVCDMDNDGLDDIVILDQSTDLKIAYQQMDGSFVIEDFGSVSSEAQWGMSVGDIDNDGHKDVICGGSYDGIHIININSPTDFDQIDLVSGAYQIFHQGSCIGDVDNDGWNDAYLCHDDGEGLILGNDGAGALVNQPTWIDMDFSSTDDSGNYGSTFTDFDRDGDTDLFIAKCRQFVSDPYDGRRTNRLLVNDGNNNYTEQAAERGLVNLQQTWTSDFADLDNDGDYDCFLTTHSGTLEIYENDGTGYFNNVTEGSGLEYSGFFLQAKWADFDNDGWVDLVHSGGDHRYFHNNGDMTFELIEDMFPATDVMHSFSIGDLNHDGWLDLYASYGDGYVNYDADNDDRLFINAGGANNFITFDLEGVISNMDAAAATVEIHGAFGVKVREIHCGESYGITNTSMCHFGLGTYDEVDFALVYWPSGIIQYIDNPVVNDWTELVEEDCASPTATIAANGNTNICPGETVELTIVNAGTNYQWSTGETTSTIEVDQAGAYKLIVWNAEGCGGTSNEIVVTVIQNEPATVQVSGDLEFCEGNSVQLIASAGNSYMWSNDETSQAITVTEAGTYTVEITNECEGSTSTSDVVEVIVFDAPSTPVAVDQTLNAPGTVTLTATGSDVRWYDAADATVAVGTGNSFETPVLNATTSYWVEDVMTHGGGDGTGGKTEQDMEAEGVYHTAIQYYLRFDAAEDLTIVSVKIFADESGDREIQVVQGNTVISETTVTVPAGENVVTINLFVPAGNGYGLKCNTEDHTFWRDKNLESDEPYEFPYDLDGLATITGTNVNNVDDQDNYYYYFYEWIVEAASWECPSVRDEVVITYTDLQEIDGITSLNIYPNPANNLVTVNCQSLQNGKLGVRLLDQTGRVVQSTNQNLATGANQFQMDLNDVATGVYQVEFNLNGNTSTTKLIVE
ncbi:MAG: FG-GAP-like repeat-containing protein [Flavobacteriales bacterium]